MSTRMIITGVLLFAVATAIIYGWGMKRQMNKSQDLMNLLFANGVSRVNKYLKKNGSITRSEVENLVQGMTAKLPFSGDKSVVTEPKGFTEQLLTYMERTGQIKKDNDRYIKG